MNETPVTIFIKKRSLQLSRRITALLAMVFLLFLSERFSLVLIDLYRSHYTIVAWRNLGLQATASVPEAIYLSALWWVRQALQSFTRGELFAPVVGQALHRVGIVLLIGALLNIFLVPILQHFLGIGPGYLIAFDIEGIVLGAVGLSLMLLAHVLMRAAELQSELDEIF